MVNNKSTRRYLTITHHVARRGMCERWVISRTNSIGRKLVATATSPREVLAHLGRVCAEATTPIGPVFVR